MLNKLLCGIGIHDFKQIGFLGIFGCLEQCGRCGCGQGFHPMSGYYRFSKSTMDEMINNAQAAPTDKD